MLEAASVALATALVFLGASFALGCDTACGDGDCHAQQLEEASKALEGYHEPLNKSRLEAKVGRCYVELRDYGSALKRFEKQLDYAKLDDGQERDEGRASEEECAEV